jgi:DNA-binding NarL/FixJ family response regulator
VTLRLLLADDFPALRTAVRRLLEHRSDISIVGEASNYAETITQLRAVRPDVLLLDLQMSAPVGFQPERIERIASENSCIVITMSIRIDWEASVLSERLGAKVKLDRKSLSAELVPAILASVAPRNGLGRHQCFIFAGAPSFGLAKIAAITKARLDEGYRCLYLNSPTMVARMRSYLTVVGTDVARESTRTSLVLSSDQTLAADGSFDMDQMIDVLHETIQQAVADGYKGLWAVGDMAWEIGPQKDYTRLLEYEWQLEDVFRAEPALHGVCQYQAGAVPPEALHYAALTHTNFFIDENTTRANPRYVHTASAADMAAQDRTGLDEVVAHLCARPPH